MPQYTVHVRRVAGPPSGDDLVLTPERFSWGAFLLGPLWFAFARAWLALALWIVLFAALAAVVAILRPPLEAAALVALAIEVFFGLEALDFRRRALERRGWRLVDVVSGADADHAALRHLGRAAPAQAPRRGDPARSPVGPIGGGEVVGGLFPDAGA